MKIELELECDYDTVFRIKCMIDKLLEKEIRSKGNFLKKATSRVVIR